MSTLRNRIKAEPQRSGMTHAKWREVQSIHTKSGAKMLHESCRPVSISPEYPRGIMVTGGTYNVGRNEAKRTKIRVLAEAMAEHNRLMRAA